MIVRRMVCIPNLGGKYSVHISFVVVPVSILRWLLVVLYASLYRMTTFVCPERQLYCSTSGIGHRVKCFLGLATNTLNVRNIKKQQLIVLYRP